MADIRDLIYRQRNRRAGRGIAAPITRTRGVDPIPLGGRAPAPDPTNPYSAPVSTNRDEVLRERYFAPLPAQTPNITDVGSQPISTRGFGTTDPAESAVADSFFGANVSEQEQQMRGDLEARRNTAGGSKAMTIEDDDSKLKNFAKGAEFALRNTQRTGNSQADLGYALGAGIFGGLRGLFTKKEDEVRERKQDLAELDKEIERDEKQYDKEIDRTHKKATTQNIFDDNEHNRNVLEERKATNEAKRVEKERGGFFKRNPYFDPATATEEQKAQLASFGATPESVGKYDFSKPNFKEIGGTTYKWDNASQSFIDSGLVKDEGAAFVDHKITDMDGNVKKFRVSAEKSASLENAAKIAGLKIEAGELKQDKTIEKEIQFKELARRDRMQEWKRKMKMSRARFQKDLEIQVNAGKLSLEQAQQMLDDFGN